MVSILRLPIPEKNRLEALRVLAKQEGSASGQTIPSYRIPIAWESLFIQIRQALSDSIPEEHDNSSPANPVSSNSKGTAKESTAKVDKPAAKRGGSGVAKKRSTTAKPI